MENLWAVAAVSVALALVATLPAIWLGIAGFMPKHLMPKRVAPPIAAALADSNH